MHENVNTTPENGSQENTTPENASPKAKAKAKEKDDRVEVFVPRGDTRGEANVVVCLNGVNYILPRGKASMVPAAVAEEYRRSERAKDKFAETSRELLEMGK